MRHIRLWVFVFIYGFIICAGLIALAVTSILLNKKISRDSSAILLQNALERSQQTMERRLTEFALNGQNVATGIARSGFNVTESETANLSSFATIWRELDISSIASSSLISTYVMWRANTEDIDSEGQQWWATGCSQIRDTCYVMNATSDTWTEVPITSNTSYDFNSAVVYPFLPMFHTEREEFLNTHNVDIQDGLFSPVYITYTDYTNFQQCNGKYVLQRITYYFCMENLGSSGASDNDAIEQCSYVLGLEAEFTLLIPPRLVAITNSSSPYVLSEYVRDETGGACNPPASIQSIVNEYKRNCPIQVNVSDCNNVFNYRSSQVVTVVSVRYRRELYVLSVDLTPKDFFFYLARRAIRISIIVSVIIIVFVICLSIFVLFSIVVPINRICYGMRMASQLSSNDNIGNVKRYTWIAEMALLYSSYKNLRKALLDLKAFVPQGLFVAPAPGTMASGSLLNILMGNNDQRNNNVDDNKISEDAYYAQNEEYPEDYDGHKRRYNGSSSSSSSSSSDEDNNDNNNMNTNESNDNNNNLYSETDINGDVVRNNNNNNNNKWENESNASDRSASYSNATGFIAASSSPRNNNNNNNNNIYSSSRSRKGNNSNNNNKPKNKRRYVDLWGEELDASEHTVQYDASESMRSTTATQNNELLSSYNNYNFNNNNNNNNYNNNLSFDYLDGSSHHINNNNNTQLGMNKRKRQGVQNTYVDPYQADWNKLNSTTRSLNKNIKNGMNNNNNNNNLIVFDNSERSFDLTQHGELSPLPSTLLRSVQTSPFVNNNLQLTNFINESNNINNVNNNYVEMTSYTNANSHTNLLNGKKNVSFLASGYGMKSIESDNLTQLMASDRQHDKTSNYKYSTSTNSLNNVNNNVNNVNNVNNMIIVQPSQSVAFKHQIPFTQLARKSDTNKYPTLSSSNFFYNSDEVINTTTKNSNNIKKKNNKANGVKNLESAVFVDVHDDENANANANNNLENKMERTQHHHRYGPPTPESYWSHLQEQQQQEIIDEENQLNKNNKEEILSPMNNNNNNNNNNHHHHHQQQHHHNNNTFFASVTSFQSTEQTNESNSFTNVSKGMRLAAYERNYNSFRSVNCSMLTIAMEFRYANTHSLTNEVATLMNISVFEILKWGGIIELLRPNLIVATFGAHHSLPQNAPLATACAIVIIRRIPPAQRPRTRLYVDSGKFFVGNCGAHHRISPVVFGDRFDFAINVIRHELCAGRVLVTDSIAVYLPQDFLCPVDYIMTLFNKTHGIQLFQIIDRVRSRSPQFMEKVNRFRAAYANAVSGQYESAISILRNGAVHDNELGFQFLTALTYLNSLHPRRPRYCRFQLPPFEPLGVEPRNTTMKYQFAKMRLNEIDQAASTEVIHFGFDNDDDNTNNNNYNNDVNAQNTRNSVNMNHNNINKFENNAYDNVDNDNVNDNVFGEVSLINHHNAKTKTSESVFENELPANTLQNSNNNDDNNKLGESPTKPGALLNRLHSEEKGTLSDGKEMNVSATKSPRASREKQENKSISPNVNSNGVKEYEKITNGVANGNTNDLVDFHGINSDLINSEVEGEDNNLAEKKNLRRQRRRRESLTRMRNSLQSNNSSSTTTNNTPNEEIELNKRNSTNNQNNKEELESEEKDIRKMSNVDTALVMSNLLPRSLHSASPLSAPLPSQSYLTDYEYDNNNTDNMFQKNNIGHSYDYGNNNNNYNNALEGFDDLPLTFMDHHNEVWHRIKTPIGAGAFAEVYRAISVNTGEIIAVKCINLTASQTAISDVVREVNISCKLFNEHIVNYTDWVHHNNYVLLLMEYMSGGSLYNILSAFPHGMPLKLARRYASDALKGLAYLHKHHFVHADFKPQNMLLSSDGLCRISDFGSSVKKAHAMQFAHDVFKLRGTALYMSPEVAAGHPPTMQSDLFSFGISLYEILTSKLPWMKIKRNSSPEDNKLEGNVGVGVEKDKNSKESTYKANQNGTAADVHVESTHETNQINTNTNMNTDTTTDDHYDQLVTLEDLGEMSEMRFLQGLANGTVVARLRHHNVLTPEAVNLISRCLQVDPSQRPEAFDLIDHPFFWA